MSESYRDAPKYPGVAAADRERLLEELHTSPAPTETLGDRVRYAFPGVVLMMGVGLGIVVVGGLSLLLVLKGIHRGWLELILMLAVFLTLSAVAIGSALWQRSRRRM